MSHTASPLTRAFEIRLCFSLPIPTPLPPASKHLWLQSTFSLRSSPSRDTTNMAEVVGAVASGLAVAEVGLKVGGTVWKLKQLWQQVHNVPETIQDLMKQIEIMDPVLCDHENRFGLPSAGQLQQLPTHNSPQAILSAENCRKALDNLRSLVEDLDEAIESQKRTRRTVARMRVVLKKDTIKGFQERLGRLLLETALPSEEICFLYVQGQYPSV